MTEAKTETILVEINGERREIPAGLTVRELLAHLDLHERLVVVERNREILRPPVYGQVVVEADDKLELVHFVGGG
jgi:thiamine biosynthesis protein ThiS